MRTRILGLPSNIFFLGLTSLFNDFSSEMVFSVFPAFFIVVLHAGAASLGLVDGIAEAASNLFKIHSGALSDRLAKRKPLVVAGYALAVVSRPFYSVVSTVPGALGLRLLDRVGKGVRDAPRDSIISLSTPRQSLGKSFGYHRSMDTVGAIFGPVVAYLILRAFRLQFDFVFVTAFIVGLFALLSLIFVSDVAHAGEERRTEFVFSLKRLSPRFRIFLISTFILSAGSLPVAIVLLKTGSLGLGIADIPLYYMLYSVSYAGFSMSAGKLSDRIGARTVIFIGYTILIGSYLLLDLAESAWTLGLGFLVFGLFPALTDGVQRSLASQLTAEEVRGIGLGWLNASVGFGALAAGIGGGYLWQAYGPASAFAAAAAIVFMGLVLLVVSA
ncbi:MFS transporter [Burkholderia pseudomultivorans]|uniref:MFS transporter n=1 Tax=Burkholderia pseudomultivorans TaxID=1207504 RepID=UPI0028764810|nr:MFS transporter [Burkholderia pseudomultivorans]MDS0859814.1 MFS transporter [Burkholderia pseudomultivorans]